MNVGQVLETHLGWAAHGLGERVEEMLADHRETEIGSLRDRLKEVYADDQISKRLDEAGDESIVALAQDARNGVHLATSVFDGASEDEIRAELDRAGLPRNGPDGALRRADR